VAIPRRRNRRCSWPGSSYGEGCARTGGAGSPEKGNLWLPIREQAVAGRCRCCQVSNMHGYDLAVIPLPGIEAAVRTGGCAIPATTPLALRSAAGSPPLPAPSAST
jgi:hypothetical protein